MICTWNGLLRSGLILQEAQVNNATLSKKFGVIEHLDDGQLFCNHGLIINSPIQIHMGRRMVIVTKGVIDPPSLKIVPDPINPRWFTPHWRAALELGLTGSLIDPRVGSVLVSTEDLHRLKFLDKLSA